MTNDEETGGDCIIIDTTAASRDCVEVNGTAADNEIGINIGNETNIVAADLPGARLRTPRPDSALILGETVCHAPRPLAFGNDPLTHRLSALANDPFGNSGPSAFSSPPCDNHSQDKQSSKNVQVVHHL